MIRSLVLSSATATLMLAGCSGGEHQAPPNKGQEETKEIVQTCTYTNASETPEVAWIAYKYTEKVGVRGEFESISLSNAGSGESPADVLSGAEVRIETASSNSGDPTRDPKIKDTFFGGLTGGETIAGKILSAEGDGEKGTVKASIEMNGVTEEVEGAYSVNNDLLEIKLDLNVASWSAMDALNALNEVCEDLHKGADGKSILWPDVTVYVSTKLAKSCD